MVELIFMQNVYTARINSASPVGEVKPSEGKTEIEFQWMPAGEHQVTVTGASDGEAKELNIIVDEAGAKAVAAALEKYLEAAAAGKGDEPFIDFNHDDQEAAGWVKRVWWGGEDAKKGGIRMAVVPSSKGKEALEGAMYKRFSPSFLVKFEGEVARLDGAPVNMGGLVNKAAFQSISPVVAKAVGGKEESGEEPKQEQGKKQSMTEDEIVALQKELAQLKEQNAALQEQLGALNTKRAEELVAKAVEAGQISADPAVQAKWVKTLATDSSQAELLASLPKAHKVPGAVTTAGDNADKAGGAEDGAALLAKYEEIKNAEEQQAFFAKHKDALRKAKAGQ